MTAAAALALAKAHGVSISLDGSDLILESRGAIPADVLASLRQAKADLVAALRQVTTAEFSAVDEKRVGKDDEARKGSEKPERALTGDDLLDALRRKGFEIKWRGDNGGTVPPLRDVVEKHPAFFRRLLTWQTPDQCASMGRQSCSED